MTDNEYAKALGRRVAANRKRRGLSQREFARLIDRSEAWVSQVERGVRRIDRMSVLESMAEVLNVPLAELAAEAPVVAAVAEASPAAGRLRLILTSALALRAVMDREATPEQAAFDDDTARAWELTHGGSYAELADLLENLLPRLESAARAARSPRRVRLFRLLAAAYQACSAALAKLGEPEAAWIAADRSIAAAERADDPLLMAAGGFRLVLVFTGARQYDQADQTARTTAEALAPLLAEGQREALSLSGALTLQRAVIAARRHDDEAAYRFLAAARETASRVGSGHNDHHTEFGPTNVALHEVSVAIELGDAGRALRTAAAIDASDLSPERRGRLLIDVARAHGQRRQLASAVTALSQAEQTTPEQVRTHPAVHQLVNDLLTMTGEPPTELQRLARKIGAM